MQFPSPLIWWIFRPLFCRNFSIVTVGTMDSSDVFDRFTGGLETLDSSTDVSDCNTSGLGMGVLKSNLHFFSSQHCFIFPSPPNLGLSMQHLHIPQSGLVHPSQDPHLFLFTPVFHNKCEFFLLVPYNIY